MCNKTQKDEEKKMKCKLASWMVMAILIGAFAQDSFAAGSSTAVGVTSDNSNSIVNKVGGVDTKVGVTNDTDVLNAIQVGGTNVSLDFGDGDGEDKWKSGLPGSHYIPIPELLSVPLQNSGVWNHKDVKMVFVGFPEIVTEKMLDDYVTNKTILVKDERMRRKIAEKFQEASDSLLENANVVLFRTFAPTKMVRLSLNPPGASAVEGTHYLKMGSITFQTREGLEKWYRDLDYENITSDDLLAMLISSARKCGSNFIVPTGQGTETMIGANSSSMNLGGLFTAALGLASNQALPLGGSLGSGVSGTSGDNKTKAEPFLSIALFAITKPSAVVRSLSSSAVKEVSKNQLKRDDYLTLAMCALPVPNPNGKTRLSVAGQELSAYLSSKRTDLKALINFQGHLAQARRDNIKGADLRLINEALAASWFERAEVVEQAKSSNLISDAEFSKAYRDNLEKASESMRQHGIKEFKPLEYYSGELNSK